MLYIDKKFLSFVSPKLVNFTQKSHHLWNFRCPFCGDSKKSSTKSRGFLFVSKDNTSLIYKCFNCQQTYSFLNFLENVDSSLSEEYRLEKFLNKNDHHEVVEEKSRSIDFYESQIQIPSIRVLPDDHQAKKYVISRKIPKQYWNILFYAHSFKTFVKDFSPEYDGILLDDSRLIIPFFNRYGKIFAFQGRALSENSSIRYVTIKKENVLKLYGLERLDYRQLVYVVEGPIDSLFLDNCIATADSNLSVVKNEFDKKNVILIYDREPRNKALVKQMESSINEGFSVCLLPEREFKYKDINEAIKNGLTKETICNIISNNTFSGIGAELEFNKWRKI